MKLKKVLTFFLILSGIFSVSAKVSANYHLDATGLTSELALATKYDVPDFEEYETYEELEKKAESVKQAMLNARIFKKVEMTIKEVSNDHYDVNLHMVSALTFIVLPYPKYDSNDGFSMMIVGKDYNFLGSLGKLDGVLTFNQQTEGHDSRAFDFSASAFDVNITLTEMMLGKANMQATIDASIDLSEEDWSKKAEVTTDITVADIHFGETKFSPVLTFKGNLGGLEGSEIGLHTDFSNIPVGRTRLFINPYFNTEVTNDGNKELRFQKAGLASGVSYNRFSFGASYESLFLDDMTRYITVPHSQADFDVAYNIFDWLSPSINLNFNKKSDADFLFDITLSEEVGMKFDFVDLTLGESTTVNFEDETTKVSFTASAEKKGGSLDYVLGDFRKGFAYTASIDALFSPFYEFNDRTNAKNYLRGHAELTWFPIAQKYFNPSLRVIISAADRHLGLFRPTELDSVDTDNGFGFVYSETEEVLYLGEYMRGIRNTDSKSLSVYNNNIAAVANLDLKLKGESTVGFFNIYFTPFIDAAAVVDLETPKLDFFASAGFDGTIILRDYPSFPARISFGCDIKKLKTMIDTKTSQEGFFELFIGTQHFY